MTKREAQMQIELARWIVENYPGVVFHNDYGSGAKLTKGQAIQQSHMNARRRGWPDLFVAEPRPRCIDGSWNHEWDGLFVELKAEGTRLKKLNGEWADDHIAEQAQMIEKLRGRGYKAEFAVGIEEAKAVIAEYLGGGEDAEV